MSVSEAKHQAAVIKWSQQPRVRATFPELALLHHIPNGGRRDAIEARHLKQQGVKAGVPDLFLPVARGGYHGLFIEMKTESGRTSLSQEWWIEQLSKQGYLCIVCQGWKPAVEALEGYMLGGVACGA